MGWGGVRHQAAGKHYDKCCSQRFTYFCFACSWKVTIHGSKPAMVIPKFAERVLLGHSAI